MNVVRVLSSLLIMSVSLSLMHCDSSDEAGGTVDNETTINALFESIAADLVGVLEEVSSSEQRFRASPTRCPDGGSASYDPTTTQIRLSGCNMGGTVVNGSSFGSSIGPNAYYMTEGTFTVSGNFRGTFILAAAYLSWSDPPTRSNTFYQLDVRIRNAVVCVTNQNLDCPPL